MPELSICLPIAEGDEEDRGVLAFRLLTGGGDDTALSPRQIRGFNPWLTEGEIHDFLEGFGFSSEPVAERSQAKAQEGPFSLPRKGRFDHAFEVDYPDAEEVLSVLGYLVSERPHVPGLGLATAAERLACRPMSDTAWVVNEAARLAVKSSKDAIDDICLFGAISKLK